MGRRGNYQNFISLVTGVGADDVWEVTPAEMEAINKALESLGTTRTGRSHVKVAELRFGLDGSEPLTLRVVADEQGVSLPAIRTQIAFILRTLRSYPHAKLFATLVIGDGPNLDLPDEDSINTLDDLFVRAYNPLWVYGFRTISGILKKSDSELLKMKNFGRKSLVELDAVLARRGKFRGKK